MKAITKNLVYFLILFSILSISFRYALSSFLTSHNFILVWVSAATYSVLVFLTAFVFGKRDRMQLDLFDIGFRFHLGTFITWSIISELWFLMGYNSKLEKISMVHFTVIFWGIGVLAHFIVYLILRKHAIKGIRKDQIFE